MQNNFDLTELPLDWEVVEFDSDQLRIQLKFESIESKNSDYLPGLLRLTFWGTHYFKSTESDAKVDFGTVISWPVLNIVSTEQE